MNFNHISERKMSGFPLSIGTGLAFESIFAPRTEYYDKERIIPNVIYLKNYNNVYINIFTLYRNLVGSLEKGMFLLVNHADIADAIMQEMEVIDSLFKVEGGGLIKPVYYNMTFKSVYDGKWAKNAQLRSEKTQYQQDFKYKFKEVYKILKDQIDIHEWDVELEATTNSKCIILTHTTIELLSFKRFHTLDLLESNTGKLKSRNIWYTKYAKMTRGVFYNLPFNKMLLVLFGDRVLIKPLPISLRRTVLEISNKRKWTPATTMSKIDLDLDLDLRDPYARKLLVE